MLPDIHAVCRRASKPWRDEYSGCGIANPLTHPTKVMPAKIFAIFQTTAAAPPRVRAVTVRTRASPAGRGGGDDCIMMTISDSDSGPAPSRVLVGALWTQVQPSPSLLKPYQRLSRAGPALALRPTGTQLQLELEESATPSRALFGPTKSGRESPWTTST